MRRWLEPPCWNPQWAAPDSIGEDKGGQRRWAGWADDIVRAMQRQRPLATDTAHAVNSDEAEARQTPEHNSVT